MDFVVVDLARVLDQSEAGRRASAELTRDFTSAREHLEGLRAQAKVQKGALQKSATDELQRSEREAMSSLDDKKAALRKKLLDDARPIVDALMREKGATLVLDAAAVVLAPAASDVTDEVIARLDAKLGGKAAP